MSALERTRGNAVGWLALVVAVAALIVAGLALDRSPADLDARIAAAGDALRSEVDAGLDVTQQRLDDLQDQIELRARVNAARVDAAARLRTDAIVDAGEEALQGIVIDVHRQLAEAYRGADGSLAAEWRALQDRLETVSETITSETRAARDQIRQLADLLASGS